ncbi:hypothetical protein [Nocardioides lijunqiniae]|uniref:hypothetical protein n=1 Tax=Nocardioides lijunqiniae TaxID=2760832 RepID=UPI0018776B52|nr:hypothetical protein [Nocardioides lijunqiniae]
MSQPPVPPPYQPPPPPTQPPAYQPSAPQAAPYAAPQPTPAPDPSTGWLQLTIQGSVMTAGLIPPTVRLNGYRVPTQYGLNTIPLPAGRWHIDVHGQWLLTYGQAALDVDIAPGHQVPVFYAMPYHQFTTGSIGFEKQKRKGVWFVYAFAGFFVALIALMVFVAFL